MATVDLLPVIGIGVGCVLVLEMVLGWESVVSGVVRQRRLSPRGGRRSARGDARSDFMPIGRVRRPLSRPGAVAAVVGGAEVFGIFELIVGEYAFCAVVVSAPIAWCVVRLRGSKPRVSDDDVLS